MLRKGSFAYFLLHKKSSGFTLIELLIVIGIIGILAGVLVILVNPVTQIAKAHDLERKNTLKQLQGALEQYFADNNSYPDTASAWFSSESGDTESDNSGDWIPGLSPKYMTQLPEDPRGGDSELVGCENNKRAYWYKSNGEEYVILAHCSIEIASELNDPSSALYDPQRPSTSLRVYEGGATAESW